MKKFLIIIISFLVVLLSFFFYQNSDSVKIKEAIKTINTFAITTELESENFFEIYPKTLNIAFFL